MTKQAEIVEIPGIALEEVISRNIRLALLLRSKNQSDLARNFGVSPATISQKMHGIIAWTIADVSKASKFLNISPGKFLEPNGLLSLDSGDDYGEDGDDGGNGGDDLPPAGMGPRYLVQPFSPDLVGNSLIRGTSTVAAGPLRRPANTIPMTPACTGAAQVSITKLCSISTASAR